MTTRRNFLASFAGLTIAIALPLPGFAQRQSDPLGSTGKFSQYLGENGELVFEGIDIIINQEMLPPARDVIVRADTVTLPTSVQTAGGGLIILARKLLVPNRVTVDTRGRHGDPDFSGKPRANDGRSAGDKGDDGRGGGNGGNGGSFFLYAASISGVFDVVASGGSGGKGEDGGWGAKGTTGPQGSSPGDVGGKGGTGGQAGRRGPRGNGGTGGTVRIVTFASGEDHVVSVVSKRGGMAPQEAIDGNRGAPGDGGPGGSGERQTGIHCDCDWRICS